MSRRGLSLIELMVAVAITAVVMSLAMSMVVTGMTIARKDEQVVASNTAARSAMEAVMRDLRLSGVPSGIYMTDPGGTPFRINSIFSTAGAAGTDELWLITPRPQLMRADCALDGSAAVVTVTGTGTLNVSCTAPLASADLLMVTNFRTAALITPTGFPTSNTVTYAEQAVAGFSNTPEKGAFLRGDFVVPVDIVHYYIETDAVTNRPQLVRSIGAINPGATAAAPFQDTGVGKQVFAHVEDLQLAFGTGVTPAVTFSTNANGALFDPAAAPVSLRVSVVGVTPLRVIREDDTILPLGPVTVEDHVAAAGHDGYRRSVFRRRVELLNVGAVNL